MKPNRIAGCFIALCCLLLASCGDGPSKAETPADAAQSVQSDQAGQVGQAPGTPHERILRVMVQTVEPAPLRDVLTLPGETEPEDDVTVGAERSGKIEWMGVREGDVVQKDQLIAKIDESVLKAEWDKAETAHALASEQLGRREKLFDKGVVAKEELDQMTAGVDTNAADLRKTRSEYDQAFVRAPVAGVINDAFVDQGEYIQAGSPVVNIVNAKILRINLNVPEMDVRFVKPGDKARILVDAYPGREWTGTVDFVAVKADSATRTFKARVIVDNADGAIRPGMLARAALLRREIPDALSVPIYVVQDKGGERVVYVAEEGLARARTVKPGAMEKDRVQILEGVAAGDRLIVSGYDQVEDGMKVEIQ